MSPITGPLAPYTSIRNFHRVSPWLFRGGQPGNDGIKSLSESGIKTVVSFRWGKKVVAAEKAAVEAEGLQFISLPLNYWNLPGQTIVDQFLAILDNAENRPIFVHCFHGSDRTGLLIAIYRIARDNWTVQQSYREMERYGFHRFRIRHFKWTLYSYARRATAPAGNPGILKRKGLLFWR